MELSDQNSIGKRIACMVRSRSVTNIPSAGTRMLEEATELCLALGASSSDIYSSVADCLYKEARKDDVYPSQIMKKGTIAEIHEEIADVLINLLYIVELLGSSTSIEKIMHQAEQKTSRLEELNKQDGLKFYLNGKFYRKKDSDV